MCRCTYINIFLDEKDKKDDEDEGKRPTIATGNWGCGAFGGDRELKFIQQIMGKDKQTQTHNQPTNQPTD